MNNPDPIYTKVVPGDESTRPEMIKPHKVRYEKIGNSMRYDMKTIERNGRQVYELEIFFNDNEAPTDRMFFDMETGAFAGRYLNAEGAGYTLDLDFADNRMTGALSPHEGPEYTYREYDKTHPHAAFEPAVINYAISVLPLEKGYTASIPTMDLNNGSEIIWANIKVEGRETITIDGKEFDTWKVVSNGIRNKVVWVSTTEPYAIQMITKGNPGTWKLVVE